jgi:hypothetical protein
MPDYVMGLSGLWPSSDFTDALVPPELLATLVAWNDEFNINVDLEGHWRSEEARNHWAEITGELVKQVRSALAGRVEFEIDLWPLPPELRTAADQPT